MRTVDRLTAMAMLSGATRGLPWVPPLNERRRVRSPKARKLYLNGYNKEREMERRRRQTARDSLNRMARLAASMPRQPGTFGHNAFKAAA